MKITVCMVTHNESENIAMAIESATRICNDFVLVDDGSTDDTIKIAKQVFKRFKLKHKIIPLKHTGKIYDTRTRALSECTGDWILVTDGDFIWHTTGTNDISHLKKMATNNISKNVHFHFPLAYLYGDYWHTLKHCPVGAPHPYLIRNSPGLRCIRKGRFFQYISDKPIIKKQSNIIFGFHAGGVKSPVDLLFRKYWTRWRERAKFKRFPTCWNMVRYHCGKDLEHRSKLYVRDYMRAWMPFDSAEHCYYPAILKRKMQTGKCLKLLYEKGRIVGRNDVGNVDKLVGRFEMITSSTHTKRLKP